MDEPHTDDAAPFMDGLAEHLTAAGLPLWRVSYALMTMHPEVLWRTVQWRAGEKVQVRDQPHARLEDDFYTRSAVARVRETGAPVRVRLLPGDPARGKNIYSRSSCSSCHILDGEGSGFGPDLTDVGARRGSAHLRQTLQNPAKTIPENFLLVEAITSSGQTIRGIRLNEDTFSIQFKDQQGRFYSFRKSELRNLKKLHGETPMPSFGSMFSPAELDDLIHFLAFQRGKP